MTAAREPMPPGRWWGDHVGETRWMLEAARLKVDPGVARARRIPHGDGRAVVLVPGFGGGDYTLAALARLAAADRLPPGRLRLRRSTPTAPSGRSSASSGTSPPCTRARAAASRSSATAAAGTSRAPSRRAGRSSCRTPSRSGADLQAMFHCSAPTLAAVEGARRVLRATGPRAPPGVRDLPLRLHVHRRLPRAVPEDRVRMTSVYSKGDGVVRWQAQLVPYADCVEVTGSHVGLIFNRKSYRAIAHALAADELGSSITA